MLLKDIRISYESAILFRFTSGISGKHQIYKDIAVWNVAFATELGDYIADSRINAWIYGHAHHRTDFYIGNTHMVSNPLGYIFAGEGAAFNEAAVIDLKALSIYQKLYFVI